MSGKAVLKPGQVERGSKIKLQPPVSGARSCGRRTSVDPGQVERTRASSCKQAANVATVGSTSHAHALPSPATGCDTAEDKALLVLVFTDTPVREILESILSSVPPLWRLN